jgi:hypothetical protein
MMVGRLEGLSCSLNESLQFFCNYESTKKPVFVKMAPKFLFLDPCIMTWNHINYYYYILLLFFIVLYTKS